MRPALERISVKIGDITLEETDAIVNAANPQLSGGGGVDGAIHRAAGPELLEECRKLGGCPTGEARLTAGYLLKAPYVIHAVGPVWQGGGHGEEKLLASCYRHALELAEHCFVRAISFPSISTGAYGFPVDRASRIALDAIAAHLCAASRIEWVHIVTFDEKTFLTYKKTLDEIKAGES